MVEHMQGKLILIVGPTGSGKGSLEAHLHSVMPEVYWSISCTTRTPRPGEKDGDRYFFITKEAFEQREQAGEFLEWAQYGGNYYGTLKSQVLPMLAEGKTVMREVEVQGARQIAQIVPKDQLKIIFIDAGSWEDLERRVLKRASMGEAELLSRRKRFEDELSFMSQADVVVKNPDGGLEAAKSAFVSAVQQLSNK